MIGSERGDMTRTWYHISVRRMVIVVAVIASIFGLISHLLRISEHERVATFHEMMSAWCDDEARLMKKRTDVCWERSSREDPWDAGDLLTEDLRCCPYPRDQPKKPNWVDQAMVWERARLIALSSAEWHHEMSRYESGSRLLTPRKPSGRK